MNIPVEDLKKSPEQLAGEVADLHAIRKGHQAAIDAGQAAVHLFRQADEAVRVKEYALQLAKNRKV